MSEAAGDLSESWTGEGVRMGDSGGLRGGLGGTALREVDRNSSGIDRGVVGLGVDDSVSCGVIPSSEFSAPQASSLLSPRNRLIANARTRNE